MKKRFSLPLLAGFWLLPSSGDPIKESKVNLPEGNTEPVEQISPVGTVHSSSDKKSIPLPEKAKQEPSVSRADSIKAYPAMRPSELPDDLREKVEAEFGKLAGISPDSAFSILDPNQQVNFQTVVKHEGTEKETFAWMVSAYGNIIPKNPEVFHNDYHVGDTLKLGIYSIGHDITESGRGLPDDFLAEQHYTIEEIVNLDDGSDEDIERENTTLNTEQQQKMKRFLEEHESFLKDERYRVVFIMPTDVTKGLAVLQKDHGLMMFAIDNLIESTFYPGRSGMDAKPEGQSDDQDGSEGYEGTEHITGFVLKKADAPKIK